MKLHVERSKPTEAVLEITAQTEELAKVKSRVLNRLAPGVKVPGFREGKVPLQVVEKNIDQSLLQNEFINEAINMLFIAAIREERLRPVSQPQVTIKKFVPFIQLEFTLNVPVVGKITLPNYKKIHVEHEKVVISAKEVDEVLARLRSRSATKKEINRPAKKGDEAIIDFKGTDKKGQPVKGAEGIDYPLVLGSGSFIPGFEDNIIGMSMGEKKSFTVKFPKNYGVKDLQGASVTFEVTLKKVHEVTEPKLDDNFAKTLGPFETLAELKKDIKKQVEHEAKHKAERDFEAKLVNYLSDRTTVAIPETLIEEQKESVLQEVRQNAVMRGMTYEDFLTGIGKKEDEYLRSEIMPEAERRVKAGLMLTEIADIEGISVASEELEARMIQLKAQYKDPKMQSELDKPDSRAEINARLRTEKVIEFLKTVKNKN